MIWALVAGIAAVTLEWIYRAYPSVAWWRLLPAVAPAALLVSYAICRMVRGADSLPDAVVLWSLAVIGLRVAVSLLALGDRIAPGTWAALGLLIVAHVVQGEWR